MLGHYGGRRRGWHRSMRSGEGQRLIGERTTLHPRARRLGPGQRRRHETTYLRAISTLPDVVTFYFPLVSRGDTRQLGILTSNISEHSQSTDVGVDHWWSQKATSAITVTSSRPKKERQPPFLTTIIDTVKILSSRPRDPQASSLTHRNARTPRPRVANAPETHVTTRMRQFCRRGSSRPSLPR